MRYGSILHLHQHGPIINAGLAEHIGLEDESRCWGIWIPSTTSPNDGDKDISVSKLPDLILTPIHPRSWPYTYRLTVRLRNKRGALASLCDILREKGQNVLFHTATQSGRRHATANMTIENLALRSKHEKQQSPPGELATESLDRRKDPKKSASLTREVLRSAMGIVEEIHAAEKGFREARQQDRYFLRSRFSEERLCSFSREQIDDAELWELCSPIRSTAVSVQPMPNLTHHWRHGSNIDSPLEFTYSVSSEVLRSNNPQSYRAAVNRWWKNVEDTTIGSFDTEEHSLRLMTNDGNRGPLFEVDVHYHFENKSSEGGTLSSTTGLLKDVAQVIADEPMNMVDVSNATYSRDKEGERGKLKIRGYLDSAINEQEAASKLQASLEGLDQWGMSAKAIKRTARTAFISIQESEPRRKELIEIVKRRAAERGLDVIVVRKPSGHPEEPILEEIGRAALLIQFYSQRNSSLSWLCAEYGMGRMQGLKPLVFIDTSMSTPDEWKKELAVIGTQLHKVNLRENLNDVEMVISGTLDRFLRDPKLWQEPDRA